MRTGIIYRATNRLNGKCYVGQTLYTLEHRRYKHLWSAKHQQRLGHDRYFMNALRKYGEAAFDWEVLEEGVPLEQLNDAEAAAILRCGAFGSNGYNSDSGGGNGRVMSEASRRKISEAMKGERNPFYGQRHSGAALEQMSLAHRGAVISTETRKKMSAARLGPKHPYYGKHRSEETKRKISAALKGRPNPSARVRHIVSAETRQKMRQSHIGKIPWNKGLHKCQAA